MVRDNWQSLDGVWYCAFSREHTIPDEFDTTIIVPFSPETELSGVKRVLLPEESLFYRRTFSYHHKPDTRVLLHFQAVDQECVVFLNDKTLGSHIGGYIPFGFDVTPNIRDENELVVIVTDKHDRSPLPKGRQRLNPAPNCTTAQSGIWQTVWLETVPETYISSLTVTPDLDHQCFSLQVTTNKETSDPVTITYDGKTISALSNIKVTCLLQQPHPWSPEDPFLYPVAVTCGEDTVQTYVAMRSFRMKDGVIFLNGKPYFHHGVLYQGYWKEGLYTPPDDQAVENDLMGIKALGFNTIRLHQKVETLKWYHLCDTLGLLVWQDMPSGGVVKPRGLGTFPLMLRPSKADDTKKHAFLGSDDRTYRLEFLAELRGMIRLLYNCPCVEMWTLFSCGLGQFDSTRLQAHVKALDGSRLVNPTDGVYDQGSGDVHAEHLPSLKYHMRPDAHQRAVVISDFGGFSIGAKTGFAYHAVSNETAYNQALVSLYQNVVAPAKQQGLAGCVYTQFHDTETESDGLVSYDRKQVKVTPETASMIRSLLFQDGQERNTEDTVAQQNHQTSRQA
ncbi:MAG: glycoside hydrolase family 2 [Sphaerochaeta sp.]|jgi:hypothetical protein|nr:glycoside hydrolase family 2 [Sphaerochaeta sp.]MCH3920702.1 glycoside hydrolase family 2 [Sphaerochaeta sp.]MCI2076566.1 glycoside hydrolase family 2 [Sphaerochaeta sp.]MCI2096467.1 glycoside hydrolase family 2 [Sphaerochaeta sp.]MCI2128936.1 glycoside hydrolase family 2 [Sphaerochaeta sp.]